MKNSSIIFCIIITVLLSACTKKIFYLTPEVHGKVYDSVSKKPLPRNHAKIGFDGLTGYEAPPIILKADGGFILPAVTKTYFFIRPNVKNTILYFHKYMLGLKITNIKLLIILHFMAHK